MTPTRSGRKLLWRAGMAPRALHCCQARAEGGKVFSKGMMMQKNHNSSLAVMGEKREKGKR